MRRGKQHWLWIFVGIEPMMILVLLIAAIAGGCSGELDVKSVKNRVPTMPAQLDQAQQAAKDAQAADASVQQTQKNIQDAIAKLDSNGRKSDGSVKIGHPEISGVGTVTEVGMNKITISNVTTSVLWFTFAERQGFTKKFDPVCPEAVIPVSKTVILNYHFREYQDDSHPGCSVIDSYTVVQ
jgi:hypothetical protein